ncbi:MAG TPA: serine/threonine-protein kinase [Polyangia bacterium]|nr:serine/threonine-protein kinase [Polyangia bacterium]
MDCPDDKTLVAFAEGRLPRDAHDPIEGHVLTCARCLDRISHALGELTSTGTFSGGAQVRPRARPEPADAHELPRGAAVGRYTVLGLVGRGGMGEVYAAYDPELDRKVALKLLVGHSHAHDERARARLLREAKAIAKVSHANVIVVHDAGTYGERVFVAMEFVDGPTLKAWLETPRARREILSVFASAARGLAAAHAAGLVHRDFKPHNVMVAMDGHVRVMDFGLAREIGDARDDALVPGATPEDLELTRTGELVGTPLYMAPEQFRAQRTDARTDQFAFCVALYQALYGAHPFGGGTIDALATNVLAGAVRPPPAKHDVPAWLRRVLLRGLSVAPDARWPSMAALLAALENDPNRVRRRWGATVGLGLLVVAAIATLARGPRRSGSLCRGGPARLAGVWEPLGAARPRRDAIEAAFVRAGGPSAHETWQHVEPLLDRYATAWLDMYRDACEATQVRGEQSPETLDLRMACLDERRTTLAALTDVLANADGVAVSRAIDAANALPSLDRCTDVRLLRETVEPPRDAATRVRVGDIRTRLAVAKALADTGKADRALARGRALIAEARALGYRPLLAETLSVVRRFQLAASTDPEAARDLEESVWIALSIGRDDVAADSATRLVAFAGDHLGPLENSRRWTRLVEAILDRMGPGHDRQRIQLLWSESIVAEQTDPKEAAELARRGLALAERLGGPDDPDAARSLYNIAEAERRLGQNEEALAAGRRAQGIMIRMYGPESTEVTLEWSNEGETLLALGRAREALSSFQRSMVHIPEDAGDIASYPLTGIGRAWIELGQPKLAVAPLERALRLRESVHVPVEAAETRFALARALWDSGEDRRRARQLAAAAREGYAHTPDARSSLGIERIDAWRASHR